MPPKGRNKHPLGIWYIFGTERTRSIELLDFADFASVNILKNILNADLQAGQQQLRHRP